ncbi:ATP-binding cassette domain-containing protein [Chloroflexales bacterium ZM16-3]|nr:ATP-binding cassette domain-containing protein [Chloroflexales bacterium ZM16-3]
MEVSVHNLTKVFGTLRANDGVSLRFAEGQIHGVLGENGAGKSTLMKLLSGFLRPDGGEVLLEGKPVALGDPGAALRAGVGMVHQEPLDVPGFSALENLLCAAPRWALPSRTEARNTLTVLAGRLGFSVAPDDPISALTVGQRQQLEIIRLLACGARALILDEPTTGITAAQARSLFVALRRLAAEGNTVLFVSHKLDEVADLCDTVSVLRAGRVVGEGQMAMPQPQERLLRMMFGGGGHSSPQVETPRRGVSTAPPAWQLNRVAARDGNMALTDLNLAIPAGAVVGLAGLEGSGQQILLRLLCGQFRPSAGRISLAGADLTGAGAAAFRRGGVEYLPADRLVEGVVGPLTLAEHFALLQPEGAIIDRRAAEGAARQAITDYSIKAMPASPIMALSGGNQQRAMLAMIPDNTRALVCEQPTRGLDVASARAIWGRLLARRDAGCAVVFATADLDEILEYSDYVLVFFAGQISRLLPRAELSAPRLAELIGGVDFATVAGSRGATAT